MECDNMCSCFYATTKYQIMNALHITMTEALCADLYILDAVYLDAEDLCRRVRDSRVFRNVYTVDVKKYLEPTSNGKFNHVFSYLLHKGLTKHVIKLPNDYDTMFFCTGSVAEQLARFELCKKDVRLFFYDEGVASYIGSMENISGADAFFRKLCFGSRAMRTDFPKYLHAPELYVGDADGALLPIKPLQRDSEEAAVLSRIFAYTPDMSIPQKYIVFDMIEEQLLDQTGCEAYRRVCEDLNGMFREEVLFKLHPSDHRTHDSMYRKYPYNHIPFEIINMNQDFSQKVLITFCSSAVITPKMLFDEEPAVILLYRLFAQHFKTEISGSMDRFFRQAAASYRNRRMYIPESPEELNEILKSI